VQQVFLQQVRDYGWAFASACGKDRPAPVATKVCKCTVDTGKGMPVITTSGPWGPNNGKKFDWKKDHDKGFREITCTGCRSVEVHDDDHSGYKDHKYVASKSKKNCCGSKTCRFEARGFFCSADLCDDVDKIYLNGAC